MELGNGCLSDLEGRGKSALSDVCYLFDARCDQTIAVRGRQRVDGLRRRYGQERVFEKFALALSSHPATEKRARPDHAKAPKAPKRKFKRRPHH